MRTPARREPAEFLGSPASPGRPAHGRSARGGQPADAPGPHLVVYTAAEGTGAAAKLARLSGPAAEPVWEHRTV